MSLSLSSNKFKDIKKSEVPTMNSYKAANKYSAPVAPVPVFKPQKIMATEINVQKVIDVQLNVNLSKDVEESSSDNKANF